MVKALFDAGVPIVAGTDGALPGYSLLRSLELYVEAGLTPMQAIESATEPVFSAVRNFSAINCVFHATPEVPRELLPVAPIMPATCVP